ncbi:MAG: hypothetical protein Q8J63_09960 [Candidatus Aquicultor sp.]|nr:hypothetical protein [Candidatus Aquicultor sp.]
MSTSNRSPAGKPFEVFNRNRAAGVLGSLNNFLGNYMVGVSFKSSLAAREFLEVPLGGFGTARLKGALEFCIALACLIDRLARETCSFTGHGEADYPNIDPDSTLRFNWSSIRKLNTETKIKVAAFIQKVGLTPDFSALKLCILTKNNRDFKPTVKAKDTNGVKVLKGKYTLVINNSRMRLKLMQPLSVCAVRLADFANSAHGELGGKTVGITDIAVAKMVQSDLAKGLFLPGYLRDVVAGFVKNLNGFYKRALLFFGWQEFDLNNKFHSLSMARKRQYVKRLKKGGACFLPCLKDMGFQQAEIL